MANTGFVATSRDEFIRSGYPRLKLDGDVLALGGFFILPESPVYGAISGIIFSATVAFYCPIHTSPFSIPLILARRGRASVERIP